MAYIIRVNPGLYWRGYNSGALSFGYPYTSDKSEAKRFPTRHNAETTAYRNLLTEQAVILQV